MGQVPALIDSSEVAASSSLDQLAETANREHEETQAAALSVIEHAARAGQALLAARELVGVDDWLAWLDDNFNATSNTAYRYMRIARFTHDLQAAGITTITDAMAFLAGREQLGHKQGERRQKALELRSAGHGVTEIARILGVRLSTVQGYFDPETQAARRERARRKRIQAARALEQAQRERRVKRAARSAGGAIERLYADAERMQDTIGDAVRQADTEEARAALILAGEHYRKMRDDIVNALLRET